MTDAHARPIWAEYLDWAMLMSLRDDGIAPTPDVQEWAASMLHRWDAAPADPTEAARNAAEKSDGMTFVDITDAVLAALGAPQ